ncbi:thiol-disulfide oxidoreductase DCC family protein [Cohnella terricola]|uniref:Thiol-disulfide oxidoreductase DCC family protein n=1 Tax=Cohnella terricola TaxID=1289167 RepID=A0A559JCU2_9BACL|nr:thiol-disulfide oxidoreductase DCC family protein [Cohnella terricola]TVX97690.1 thiol-disulfide oxidoreductase DCC family protein [Cohnella terricola]
MNGRSKATGKPILLLIDGQCNLCHGIARFVIRRDHKAVFRFASLQSSLGQRLLSEGGLRADDLDTFVMIEDGSFYTKSTAALRTCRRLGMPWALTYAGMAVPRALRDKVYDWIAARRYGWFGRHDRCLVPTPDVRGRFVEDGTEEWRDEI